MPDNGQSSTVVEYPAWGASVKRMGVVIHLYAADDYGDAPVQLSAVEARDVATALLCAVKEAEAAALLLDREGSSEA